MTHPLMIFCGAIVFALGPSLVACETSASAPQYDALQRPVAPPKKPRPSEAVALFLKICGDTLPDFEGAYAAMKTNGITDPASKDVDTSSVLAHPSGTPSFMVIDRRDGSKMCSMVMQTTYNAVQLRAAMRAIGAFDKRQPNPWTYYKGALVIQPRIMKFRGENIFNLHMISAR